MSLVNMLYNVQLLRYIGENGVAAYGTMMYVNMIFLAIFIGYSIGTSPVVGFHLGAENYDELKGLLKKSMIIKAIRIDFHGLRLRAYIASSSASATAFCTALIANNQADHNDQCND